MKTNQKAVLCLLLGAATAAIPNNSGQGFVQNPSFESNYNESGPHYGPIDNWAGGSGVNESTGPFHNGPTPIPDRTRVAFIQGSANLSQEITGLTVGKQYWIQFSYDARNCCGGTIDLVTKFADKELDRITNVRPAVLSEKPYANRTVKFTAESESETLMFTTIAAGDATVLLDGITILERGADDIPVHNSSFEASGSLPALGPVEAMAGWTADGVVGVDGAAGATYADNGTVPEQELVGFIDGVGSLTQTIPNLIVDKNYEVTVQYNAKSGTSPHIQIKVNGTVLFEEDVAPVGGTAAYKTKTVIFKASGITAELSIAQSKDGAHVLLLDNVRVKGETQVPLPPLGISPNVAEMAPGQETTVTITVPTELLAQTAATLTFRSSNANVMQLVDADETGIVTLSFDKNGANQKSIRLKEVARGTARLEVVESAGLSVLSDLTMHVVTSFVRNASFETSPAPGGVGYGSIVAWTGTGGSGLNKAAGPFHDNGAIPDREQVAFVQGSGSLSQEIFGLNAGEKYWLQFYYNARNCCGGTINLTVRFAGNTLVEIANVTPVLDQNSYHFRNVEFTPSVSSGLLEFVATANGDASLLLDGVNIVKAGEIVVKNPSFEASGSPVNVGYLQPLNIAGWELAAGGRGVNVNGVGPFSDNGRSSDQDRILFLQGNGAFLSQTVSGLTANEKYTLIVEANARNCCGPEASVIRISVDDVALLEQEITPIGAANPYPTKYVVFTANGPDAVIKLEGATPTGDHTVLYDNVRIMKGEIRPAPRIAIQNVGDGTIRIAWSTEFSTFKLQTATSATGPWTDSTEVPVVEGAENVVIQSIGAGNLFFRLAEPAQ